jgi:hypothetical protein
MPHLSLDGQVTCVDSWSEVECDLHVSEIHGGGDSVDADVGWPERGPEVVRVSVQSRRGLMSALEMGTSSTPVTGSCGHHGADEMSGSHGGDQLGSGRDTGHESEGLI